MYIYACIGVVVCICIDDCICVYIRIYTQSTHIYANIHNIRIYTQLYTIYAYKRIYTHVEFPCVVCTHIYTQIYTWKVQEL